MNVLTFLILVTYTWTSCVSQCTRIIVYEWSGLHGARDPITRLKSQSQAFWSNGTFFNPIVLRGKDGVLKYDVTVRTSNYRNLLPDDMLLKINMDINDEFKECDSSVEYLVPKEKCYDPNLSGRQFKNQLSITSTIREDICDEIVKTALNEIAACCLDQVSRHLADGQQVGEYRIMYRQQEKFEYDIARRYLQAALVMLSEKEIGCLRNAYWID
ncbi:hypothetical protein EG68_05213 [Paragonimus skrjabini miyazakii]|uniref:Uncharacterized protein n=1 Tax=Paragonimus skrjabini miyazakii TaxID=59628 RepID=A0A8S9YVA9_9TREM|nr:hypothetical protein EG68_05213 [Paragonimus skrjabini miyazakii]